MKALGEHRSLRSFSRFAAISVVLAKHGCGDILERLTGRAGGRPRVQQDEELFLKSGFPSPQRIRLALEELGPSFVKLGQLMSTRADLFPPEYTAEFTKLQDSVPPVPFAGIRRIVEGQLKRPMAELFREFHEEPVAAASVAQVHYARLHSGEEVAVKVVRPGIKGRIREDIGLMYALAARFEKMFEVGRILRPTNLIREFERVIFRELDMFIEAGSLEKFALNFRDSSEIHIPKVYWDCTARSVLVMERIEGIKMDQVEAIKAHGIDPKEVARIGLRSFSRQLMEFGFFHADPHPGNTIVMYDGRVALVDFGITGYLDSETMLQIARLFFGYAEHDYDMVLNALLEAGLVDEKTAALKSFRTDLKDVSESFYGRSLSHISVKDVYEQVMRLVFKYRLSLPQNLLLLLKTFVQTEALGKILHSDASILEVTRPYARDLVKRGLEADKLLRNFVTDARQFGKYAKGMPRLVHEILKQTAGGRQRFELHHDGFENLDGQVERGINRLTVGMIICASIVAGSLVLNAGEKVVEFPLPLLGLAKVSLTGLLGVAGYSIATILGIVLIVSIFRSGKF